MQLSAGVMGGNRDEVLWARERLSGSKKLWDIHFDTSVSWPGKQVNLLGCLGISVTWH